MSKTDVSEKALESLIVDHLVTHGGYILGQAKDYDRNYAIDPVQLFAFLLKTQPKIVEQLGLEVDGNARERFFARLQGEIAKRGIVDVLRNGVKHLSSSLQLFYGTPSGLNQRAVECFEANIFTVTRQLRYSNDETQLALDMCIFINGLPIATFELKNLLTKQTVQDAVIQYKTDRDERELLFQFGRCVAHFAVDDQEVRFCTELAGKESWFLPFNKGYADGAGNPPNPQGIKTEYLWKDVLSRAGLINIIENYAQIIEEKNEKTGKIKRVQIFPRYHQLDVVTKLLADAKARGVGRRYLIQHSAGSGKSNSIAWLAHQLVDLEKDGSTVFDTVIVVTDRRVLDKQLRGTIKQFAQVSATVGHAQHSSDLKTFIESGKKIIITTVQKFPHILDSIGTDQRDKKFAILIDEAHSSQGGKMSSSINTALRSGEEEDDEDIEDTINSIMESRKMLSNASYFAFTATPKNRTLEIFGDSVNDGTSVQHVPFHHYSMKQAIQEGFILDVLANYTPVASYYRLSKTIEDDPEFDVRKAQKKLRTYVESHSDAVRAKAEIMLDHFHEQVIAKRKIGGQARAMVVTNGVERAIQYFFAMREYLQERKSPYKAIIAFAGDFEFRGTKVNEASLNGFASNLIEERIQEDPYRILICADKFQTGYDEPLLHTMYVDKTLSGIKAVQTLSRLNRAHRSKHDTFVLDFHNDAQSIQSAFDRYYRTTILSGETDPNRLHDLKSALDAYQIYSDTTIDFFVDLYLSGAERDRLDPILDHCRADYQLLDEDAQIDFKNRARSFVRTYNFLASILPFTNAAWEKLNIFLSFLVPKLPPPREEDLSKGVLETIDMDSYRAEVGASMRIALTDCDAEIGPAPTAVAGGRRDVEIDRLSNIVRAFNEQFGNIEWKDADKIRKVIVEEIPDKVAADKAYQNAMKHSDKQNARFEHDKALGRVIVDLLSDHTELFKQYSDNADFKKWLADTIFAATYDPRIDAHDHR